ncbi:MAG: tetratricopeptide repeat protein [Bacteroidales bacterium]|jgi:tetratricopeptide (TPR) repeat protein
MKKSYRFLFSCILAALIGVMPLLTFSQEEESEETTLTRKEKRQQFDKFFFVNLNAGAMLNHTDIFLNKFVPSPNHWRFGYGGMFGWQFHPVFGVRGQVSAGKLYGERIEAWWLAPYEEVYYKANLFDYHLDLIINFSNLISGYNPDRLIDIYGVGGIGQVQWKTEAFNAANDELIRQNGIDPATQQPGGPGTEEGFGTRTMVMEWPVGLGAAFHVAPKLDITLEAQLRFVDSDRLDNFKNGNMMIYRDMYSYTSLGLTYKFGKTDPLKKMTKEFDNVVFKVDPDPLQAHGGKVPIKITGTFPKDYFHPNAAMYITPVLKCDDGSVTELEPILLKGTSVSGEGIVIPEGGGTFTYETVMDYEEGMKACDLIVESIAFVPKSGIPDGMTKDGIQEFKNVKLPDRKIADGIIYTPARFAFKNEGVFAPHGYEKVTILSKEAKLFFFVNRHDLNWNVPLNKDPENKARLNELYDHMKLGYEIKDINIDGWASPEGEETFNQGLSERRAKTAHTYLIGEIRKLIRAKGSLLTIKDAAKDIQYNLVHHGPDWNGFLYHVQNSDIRDRNIILNVINSAGTPAKKEQEIRNMVVIYPELEEKILTKLRRAEIVVNVYEPKKTDEEIADLATSNPRQLNEKELLYAATLTDDNKTRLDIYKSAISIFNESYKAYANAGAIEIEMGDLNAAKAHLEKAASLNPNSGEVHNNLGVVYALQNDLAKADEHFTKASQLGTDASYNQGVVSIFKGEYTKAINLFGNTTCDYNVALAYIASKNYPPAEKQLECAEKDAQTHYLMAILGARTDNSSMLFENLGKAIEMNPAYKAEAKVDREFIKYFADPNFTSLVN